MTFKYDYYYKLYQSLYLVHNLYKILDGPILFFLAQITMRHNLICNCIFFYECRQTILYNEYSILTRILYPVIIKFLHV